MLTLKLLHVYTYSHFCHTENMSFYLMFSVTIGFLLFGIHYLKGNDFLWLLVKTWRPFFRISLLSCMYVEIEAHLYCSMIQHFLPCVVKWPIMRVAHEPLFGQCNCFLSSRVDFWKEQKEKNKNFIEFFKKWIKFDHTHTIGSLKLSRRLLTFNLRQSCFFQRIMVRPRLFNATAQFLS